MQLWNAVVLALGLCSVALADEPTGGYLLAIKEISNTVVVSGRDLSFKYTLVNIGDRYRMTTTRVALDLFAQNL